MNLLTFHEVNERLKYDPDSGLFTWKTNRVSSRVGKETGAFKDGYRQILIARQLLRAHRIAWLLMTGAWPDCEIDHVNLDRSDNRWVNLRSANKRLNAYNTGIRSDNSSGFKGVAWDSKRQKWRADIRLPHVRKHLGMFSNPEDAHVAYATAVAHHFGEFGRLS